MSSDQDSNDAEQKPQLTRRDLLQGKLGRLLGDRRTPPPMHAPAVSIKPPVMRYPRSAADVAGSDRQPQPSEQPPKAAASINGISIAPVRQTATVQPSPVSRRRAIPVFRPPGAIAEESFLNGCTRCGECIKACPHGAIVHAPERLPGVAGTPILEPDRQPCLMCDDYPCIRACDPGVLTDSLPTMMGTARVTEHLCVAHHGTNCTVCSENCPVDDAIAVKDGKPAIREDLCSGCGVCRHVCPAPENAILLMPTFNRPSPSMADAPRTGEESDDD